MPKRSSTRPKHLEMNQLAESIVKQATVSVQSIALKESEVVKNPAAVALGRLGGLKGGKARAEKMSKERRSEIARIAASARWSSKKQQD